MADTEKTAFRDNALRVVAIIGLVAVLLLGAWGIIQLAFFVPTIFSGNWFGGLTADKESVTVPSIELQSGKVTSSGQASTVVLPTASAKAPAAKTASKTASAYKPSDRTSNLYGQGDLSVRILSVSPSNAAGQATVQFEVSNTGTNIVSQGWSFNALLPTQQYGQSYGYAQSQYTYPSGAQQALYPGDRIVFTLGFNAGYSYNQYNWGTCYTYNGYANYPAPCTGRAYPYPYGYSTPQSGYGCAGYNYGYGYNSGCAYNPTYGTGARQVTITADPYNQVWEGNEANNTASAQVY